jgi:formamidopyrimidine-DNA glycosylase
MPELAEVEYHRRRWDCGVRQRILRVELHSGKRIFRGVDLSVLRASLTGAMLRGSEAHGKQMLFRFSRQGWLGLHLGMTGNLRAEPTPFTPGKHDHLVLHQRKRALVFNDARLFGRVLFHRGRAMPAWWTGLPPALTSPRFTRQALAAFLQRHAKAPIKAVLLDQAGFPGVGNWMADEILWRAKIHPRTPAGRLSNDQVRALWRQTRVVCSGALRIVSPDHANPPASWLFPHRWEKGGRCPRDGVTLARASMGGRTTAWCPRCQGSLAARAR